MLSAPASLAARVAVLTLATAAAFAARIDPEPVHAPELHLAPVTAHPSARGREDHGSLAHEREM